MPLKGMQLIQVGGIDHTDRRPARGTPGLPVVAPLPAEPVAGYLDMQCGLPLCRGGSFSAWRVRGAFHRPGAASADARAACFLSCLPASVGFPILTRGAR